MSDNFAEAKVRFLQSLCACENGARRRDLPPADRRNDLVRQSCRREGLAVYEARDYSKRWFITDAGFSFLKRMEVTQ